MKTHLSKEEIDIRMKAISEAFKRVSFNNIDFRAAGEAISSAFKKSKPDKTSLK